MGIKLDEEYGIISGHDHVRLLHALQARLDLPVAEPGLENGPCGPYKDTFLAKWAYRRALMHLNPISGLCGLIGRIWRAGIRDCLAYRQRWLWDGIFGIPNPI